MASYCQSCEQQVQPTKHFSAAAFIAWIILGMGAGAIVYLLYYLFKRKKHCPICGMKV